MGSVNVMQLVKDTMHVLQNVPGAKSVYFDVKSGDLSEFRDQLAEEYHYQIMDEDSAVSVSESAEYFVVTMFEVSFVMRRV